jgi:hypothetical protein
MTDDRLKNKDILYNENITSNRTEALFLALSGVFGFLSFWSKRTPKTNRLSSFFPMMSGIFFFYSLNYRKLNILISQKTIRLTFGIFSWEIPFDHIKTCEFDELPPFLRYGGAGIHFFIHRNRYRASFNFLEYPRIVISLKQKYGPVEEISFSTRQPDEILSVIQTAIASSHPI